MSDFRDISRLKSKFRKIPNLQFWGKNSAAKKSDFIRLKSTFVQKKLN